MRLSVLALSMGLAGFASCGDWPWPKTNPVDPYRCDACEAPYYCVNGECVFDPCREESCSGHGSCEATEDGFLCTCHSGFAGERCERCAVGYQGYPACAKDFCYKNACSGHGTCVNGVCVCRQGYAGSTCERCARGYTGYPNCACGCSKPAQVCKGNSLEICDGCALIDTSCDTECAPKKGVCGVDPSQNLDVCWCSAAGHDVMIWTFANKCSSPGALSVGVYDTSQGNAQFGNTRTLSYGSAVTIAIECMTGHLICYGAWSGSSYWGCGQNCSEAGSDCCITCGSTLLVQTINLTCN